jgi:uncharacterized protein YciI
MHALVLLTPRRTTPADAEQQAGHERSIDRLDPELYAEHERFIDRLDQADKVVLGGRLRPAAAGFEGAYVVRRESLDEAREISASDPYVRADALDCEVVEWELVGINPDAVDRGALLY